MKNIGSYDALMRVGLGSLALAWASGRSRWHWSATSIALCGAVLLAEGITRFSPFNAIMSLTTVEDEGDQVVAHVGPVTYRRQVGLGSGCMLWGVMQEMGEDGSSGSGSEGTDRNRRRGWRKIQ